MEPAAKAYIAAVVLALLWIVEGIYPLGSGRSRRLRHYAVNLTFAVINAGVAAAILAGLLLALSEASRANSIGLFHRIDLPSVAEWTLVILLFDAWQYWWHRLNHRIPLLWRFHAIHHSDAEMDASAAVRFHPGEIALSAIARMAIIPLLGMSMPQLALYEAMLLPVILLQHGNVAVPAWLDAACRWLIVTPGMHWVHHSRVRRETDSNYSSLFSWWDHIFGSYREIEDPGTIQLGLESVSPEDSSNVPRLLLAPFRASNLPEDRER